MADAKITALNTLTNAGLATGDKLVIEDADATETKAITIGEIDNRFAAASHVHATTDITSGTFADARIAASNVTQHQAALSITESQISDLQSYLLDITAEALSTLSDVTITTIASGEVLKWNGSAWINNTLAEAGIAAASHSHTESDISDLQSYLLDITAENLSSLADVTITTIASGELLKWNGSAWINNTLAEAGIAAASHSHTESDISDLQSYLLNVSEDTTPQLGGSLDVNGNSIVSASDGDIAITPNGTGDIILDGQKWPQADGTNGQVLSTNGSGQLSWEDDATGGASGAMDDLTDVTITAVASGEVLKWNGSAWINNTLAEAGIAAASHSHTESDISDLQSYLLNVSEDTTPQLGGSLDVNGNAIVSASNGDITITPNGSGDIILDGQKWPQADGTNGQVLHTNGSGQLSWGTDDGSGGAINDLSDVTITSAMDGEVLQYDSGAWVNLDLASAGISATSHTHTAYAQLAGRSGGQDLIGGTSNQEDLTLESTSHVDKGIIQSKDAHQFDATAYFSEVDNGNSSTADTIDFGAGNKHKSTLTGNCTYTFTAPPGPCNLILRLIQDGTGSRTVTWPAAVKWPGGTAPTLTTDAAAIDIVSLYYDGTNYYAQTGLDFS